MGSRLMFIDTETGGLDPRKHSLLSVGVVVWDDSFGELFAEEYYIRYENYCVTKTAARINHFDETKQKEISMDPNHVVEKLIDIKKRFFEQYESIPLAGHNISFDVQFLRQLFDMCGRSYEKLFSHRLVDTYSIIKFLTDCRLVPKTVNSSASAFKYFGITVNGRHTSLGDAKATMQLYAKLLAVLRSQTANSCCL